MNKIDKLIELQEELLKEQKKTNKLLSRILAETARTADITCKKEYGYLQ
jgi:hypothetical protein